MEIYFVMNLLSSQVLCVGNLHNPDVRYSFSIPIEEQREQFVWDLSSGPWQECSRMCQGAASLSINSFLAERSHVHVICVCLSAGERRQKAVCIRKSDRLVVSEQRCEHLPRPRGTPEPCNTDCELRYKHMFYSIQLYVCSAFTMQIVALHYIW